MCREPFSRKNHYPSLLDLTSHQSRVEGSWIRHFCPQKRSRSQVYPLRFGLVGAVEIWLAPITTGCGEKRGCNFRDKPSSRSHPATFAKVAHCWTFLFSGGSAVKSFFLPFTFLSQPCAYVAVLCLTPGSAVILSRPTFCGLIHRISVGSEVLRLPTITNRCPDVGSIQSTKVISASDSAASII